MDILEALKEKLDCEEVPERLDWSLGGLNQTAVAQTDKGIFFLKRHQEHSDDMYEAEAIGLQKIIETKTVRVPIPYAFGLSEEEAYLILERLDIEGHTAESQRALGEKLAEMHLTPAPRQFGFDCDNTIGTTPQKNPWTDNWVDFFINHRLDFQLQLVEELYRDTELRKKAEPLLNRFPDFFEGLHVKPSLLHGDLWGGNTGKLSSGEPVVYDPAAYYGHHEAEFGIIEMFGGFTREFYRAYEALIPRQEGFQERVGAYRLYHILNHYVIFGDSYRSACLSLCNRYH